MMSDNKLGSKLCELAIRDMKNLVRVVYPQNKSSFIDIPRSCPLGSCEFEGCFSASISQPHSEHLSDSSGSVRNRLI